MFSLDKQMAKITGVNLRSERHGDDQVPACDIGISVDLPNTCLAEFHPLLRDSFFRRDEAVQEDMLDGTHHLPLLKFPGFPSVMWPTDLEGYQFIGHTGIGGPSEIKLIDSKIKKVKLTFKEGGSVGVGFQVQAHPQQNDIGKLSTLIQKEVQITLVPPDEAKQFEIAQEKERRRAKAEAAFGGNEDEHTGDLLEGRDENEGEEHPDETSTPE